MECYIMFVSGHEYIPIFMSYFHVWGFFVRINPHFRLFFQVRFLQPRRPRANQRPTRRIPVGLRQRRLADYA